jgi:hypothetical protein
MVVTSHLARYHEAVKWLVDPLKVALGSEFHASHQKAPTLPYLSLRCPSNHPAASLLLSSTPPRHTSSDRSPSPSVVPTVVRVLAPSNLQENGRTRGSITN